MVRFTEVLISPCLYPTNWWMFNFGNLEKAIPFATSIDKRIEIITI